jgi:hypothetical protein
MEKPVISVPDPCHFVTDPYPDPWIRRVHWILDPARAPDPSLFDNFQDVTKNKFFPWFILIFCLLMKGSRSVQINADPDP